jgi:hypothetical protein
MSGSIFSTYSTGENRVTASILAVVQSLGLTRTERLLGALLQESEFTLVRFENQPAKGGQGVPDAVIAASCRLLIETKTARNSLKEEQLRRHLKRLEGQEAVQRLLVLSPDDNPPEAVARLNDKRAVWASFGMLEQAIEELLKDPREVISEREAFLLRNLQLMLTEEELVGSANDVVVVPAAQAWPDYLRYSAYVCQPKRPFQHVDYMAFYASGAIQTKVARILEVNDAVPMEPDSPAVPAKLTALVKRLVEDSIREHGAVQKVFLLSPSGDERTVTLPKPILNNLTSSSGRNVAFTQNQRYVPLIRLRVAEHTSDLVGPTLMTGVEP